MMMNKNADYSVLDQPMVLAYLFHPRSESPYRESSDTREDVLIPVEDQIHINASFHLADKDAPVILYFHGNGEIVSDYDDMGPMFNRLGINFFVADYRGYGSSTGSPTVTSMMEDCHTIFSFLKAYMNEKELTGPVIIMGRSLGSASALELAAANPDDIKALIIESGFAFAGPLLSVIGVDPDAIGFDEKGGFENLDKMKTFTKPCLIIHAQFDHIIPFTDGQALYDACPSEEKILLEIKGANHNDIFFQGMNDYLDAIQKICN